MDLEILITVAVAAALGGLALLMLVPRRDKNVGQLPELVEWPRQLHAATLQLVMNGTAGYGLARQFLLALAGSGGLPNLAGVLLADLDSKENEEFKQWLIEQGRIWPELKKIVFQQLSGAVMLQGFGGDLAAARAARSEWLPCIERGVSEFHQRLLTSPLTNRRDRATVVVHVFSCGGHIYPAEEILRRIVVDQKDALHLIFFIISGDRDLRKLNLGTAYGLLKASVEAAVDHGVRTLVVVTDNAKGRERNDRGLVSLVAGVAGVHRDPHQASVYNALSRLQYRLGAGLKLATVATGTRPVGIHEHVRGVFRLRRLRLSDRNQAYDATCQSIRMTQELDSLGVFSPNGPFDNETLPYLVAALVPFTPVSALRESVESHFPDTAILLTSGFLHGEPERGGGGLFGLATASRLVPIPEVAVTSLFSAPDTGVGPSSEDRGGEERQ